MPPALLGDEHRFAVGLTPYQMNPTGRRRRRYRPGPVRPGEAGILTEKDGCGGGPARQHHQPEHCERGVVDQPPEDAIGIRRSFLECRVLRGTAYGCNQGVTLYILAVVYI